MASITEGIDYHGVPLSLTFTEAGTQFVNISILDDDLVEQPEDIQLLITSSIPGRILINPSSARVRIIDNDGERDSVILYSTTSRNHCAQLLNFNSHWHTTMSVKTLGW